MHPILEQIRDAEYEQAGAAWTITDDEMGDEPEVVGTTGPRTAPPRNEWRNPVEFRLLDDGYPCYRGILDDDDDAVSQCAALEWGATHAGCDAIEVLRDDEWVQEIG